MKKSIWRKNVDFVIFKTIFSVMAMIMVKSMWGFEWSVLIGIWIIIIEVFFISENGAKEGNNDTK